MGGIRRLGGVAGLALLAMAAGCSSPTPTPRIFALTRAAAVATAAPALPSSAPVTAAGMTAAPTPALQAAPSSPVPGPTTAAGVDSDPFLGAANGLERLQTYRYRIVFEVKAAGDADQALRIELEGEHQAPDRERVRWLVPGGGQFEAVVWIGDQLWLNEGEAWNMLSPEEAKEIVEALVTPKQVWDSFAGDLAATSKPAGEETVNGIRSLRYTSTTTAWGAVPLQSGGTVARANGDVWLSRDGAFPVRARFVGTGTDQGGEAVTLTFEFDVLDVNEPLIIEPPQ